MRSHGILMSGEMVRAYLAGRKNQTRRTRGLDLINQKPDNWQCDGLSDDGSAFLFSTKVPSLLPQFRIKPPYGYLGDELWFKETWRIVGWNEDGDWCIEYKDGTSKLFVSVDEVTPEQSEKWWIACTDDCDKAGVPLDDEGYYRFSDGHPCPTRWRSSMFLPRWASRIVNKVTGVRVERLHSISEEDARNEGVTPSIVGGDLDHMKYKSGYMTLWNEINGAKLPYEKNPWVWVYEFPFYDALKVGITYVGGGEVA